MKITTWTSLTLDGVMQEPENWAHPYHDDVMMREAGVGMAAGGPILLGRRTYEQFYDFWPKQTDDNPFTEVLNNSQKYVVSTTLEDPLPWQNSTLLKGDAAETVAALKEQDGQDAVVLGSAELLHTLIPTGLIDSYTLLIHPLVLGSGKRMFPDGSLANLRLVNTIQSTTGVIIATFEPV